MKEETAMTGTPFCPQINKPAEIVRFKTQGHLALLEWDNSLPGASGGSPRCFGPRRKSQMDRCYDGGTLALLAVTVAALAVSLARF